MKYRTMLVVASLVLSANAFAADITGQAVIAEKQVYVESGGTDLWVLDECIPKWTAAQGGVGGVNMQQAASQILATVGMCKCLGEARQLGNPKIDQVVSMMIVGKAAQAKGMLTDEQLGQWVTQQMRPCLQREQKLLQSGGV